MAIKALRPDYHGDFKDRVEEFGGAILVFIGWDKHLFYASPRCYPLPRTMTFKELTEGFFPQEFAAHPECAQINWETAQWLVDNKSVKPTMDQTLTDVGIGHKSLVRLQTPELKGYKGAGV
jgi:phenol hydroxylase P4 protein